MMFQIAERRRLSDVVANRIREFIVQNELRPGDRLPTELEMAQQFGVSRVSVREATKALGFLGILEATPRRGTTVGQVDLHRVTQFLALHPALRDASATQLIDTRHVLELGMLPHLCERMQQDPSIYEQLNDCLAEFSSADDLMEWIDLDREFHSRMMDGSGLSPLFLFHELLAVFFSRIQECAQDPQMRDKLVAELPEKAASHQRIIDFLRDGNLEQAQRELKDHISTYHHVLNGSN